MFNKLEFKEREKSKEKVNKWKQGKIQSGIQKQTGEESMKDKDTTQEMGIKVDFSTRNAEITEK